MRGRPAALVAVGTAAFVCELVPGFWLLYRAGQIVLRQGTRSEGSVGMGWDARVPRYLGTAFVAQFVTSLAAGVLSGPILAGSISKVLVNVSHDLAPMRASIVLELLTSVGIMVLASLLYIVLRDGHRIVALVALVLWLAEAVMVAVSMLGLYALLSLGAACIGAGTPASSSYQTLGTLFLGVNQHAGDIDMLFFCLGAVLWYALLFRSRLVPRVLSLWGLLAVLLVFVGTLLFVWDRSLNPSIALYVPYVPFELVIGLWLLIKGASLPATQAE